jgi:hypothetical protein
MAIDIELQAALGRFFGAKFRAGVLYRIHERTGSRAALEACLERYRAAREIWAGLANRAKGVYVPDITVGELRQLRGHWLERLPDIDKDVALVAGRLERLEAGRLRRCSSGGIAEALGRRRFARRLRVRMWRLRGFGRGRRSNWRSRRRRRWRACGCFIGTLRRRSGLRVSR